MCTFLVIEDYMSLSILYQTKLKTNTRTAPMKTQNKSKKTSPTNRKKQMKSKVNMEWFDNVFGFGQDD